MISWCTMNITKHWKSWNCWNSLEKSQVISKSERNKLTTSFRKKWKRDKGQIDNENFKMVSRRNEKRIKNSSNNSKRWKKNTKTVEHNFWQVTYQKEKERENRFEKLNRWKTNNGRTFEKQKHAENFWTWGTILQNDNVLFTKTKDSNKHIFQYFSSGKSKKFFKKQSKIVQRMSW